MNNTLVNVTAKAEINAANAKIAELKDFQSRNWAIGLNGDTLAPDSFLSFFTERNLPFSYYVRARGVSVGEPSAYQANIETLTQHIAAIRASEALAVGATIRELELYKSRNWAIGLNGTTLQPDGFLPFFGTRSVPFEYYVRSGGVELGSPSAYDTNIRNLQQYLSAL
ncbi:hypothetical protein WM34_33025 [Burkholderia ubonensis]|uniref:Uncharacterized protein n=1 Tax=Burkholderia ubonensis TaxID=101571 RepID=A0AAU8UJI7_9BURK|nr:hypothetical protein [Burkholderia ubonensis]AOK24778.1 hypothetical protein WK67_19725 [Burkholderia ubonensis]KVO39529.1 hypothetical protein WJ76_00145 [Burkholderia ubonensis]KVO43140.1 hypothetical protein WJ75_03410 [Burkholderia ubonensis]KVP34913.1 hypothetical protein WJ85_20090 [Burkholderia ubonensis]KVU02940.1 hypothetical protein WK62_17085 [Burkholderia ubonensis]